MAGVTGAYSQVLQTVMLAVEVELQKTMKCCSVEKDTDSILEEQSAERLRKVHK